MFRGRPKKQRIIKQIPKTGQFSPRGKPGRPDEVILESDEFEAIYMADYQALDQKTAASSMGVSQQTFSRILKKARKSVADSLVGGKIIRIK